MEAQSVVREGPASAEIIAEAESWDADLVVIGTRGHGLLKRLLLGSTARTVLHHAPMSVLIVRPSASRPGRWALLGRADGGAHARVGFADADRVSSGGRRLRSLR